MKKISKWLIWSIEHNGWWKPSYHGYTKLSNCLLTKPLSGQSQEVLDFLGEILN